MAEDEDAAGRMKTWLQQMLRQGHYLWAAPAVGSRWRHYKGGLYEVVAVSLKEDTLVPLVTYRSLEKDYFWTRTLEDWWQPVLHEGKPAFRFVQEEETA
jgi:hypothetical protein